jgi:hypothetical protein
MRRIDHLLFQADTDFIAYFEALPVPTGDYGYHDHSECFARFVASQARSKKDIRHAIDAVEAIVEGGGWNADQLRQGFFPTLNRELKEGILRSSLYAILGPRSKMEWDRLQTSEHSPQVI